jgi:hypothetical protein
MKLALNRLVGAILAAFCLTCQAATISVLPASQTVSVGSAAIVDLAASGFTSGTAPSIGTYDVNVGFDPSLLAFVSATFGTGLDVLGLGSIQTVTPGFGTVNLFELSFDTPADLNALQPNTFRLATLVFNAVAPGTSPLMLTANALGDATGAGLPASVSNGSVVIGAPTAVPEPAAWLLLMTGCLPLLFFGNRDAKLIRAAYRAGLASR